MDYRYFKYCLILLCCTLPLLVRGAEVVVGSEAVSLRAQIAADKLGVTVVPEQRLHVLNKIGRWYYVETATKDVGWIFEDLVTLDLDSYTPLPIKELTPQQVFVLTTREIPLYGQVLAYQWSASGEEVIILSRTPEGETQVSQTKAAPKENELQQIFSVALAKQKLMPEKQTTFNGGMSLSADGQKLLVGGEILNLLFLAPKFEVARRERIKVRIEEEIYGCPSFSPKSDRVAFYNLVAGELNGLENNLCLLDARGGNYQIVTRDKLDWRQAPVWAPDGLSLLFGAAEKIYLVDEALRVREFAAGEQFGFSPDGKTVAFSRNGKVYFQPVTRKEAEQKTLGESPAWHPNGTLFSYLNDGLWLEEISKPEKKRLLSATRPVWSPQGDKLLCQTSADNLVIVYLGEVLDINYVYDLDLGRQDGLKEDMLLSVYRPQIGLKNQTVGYNQESWQGLIRVINVTQKSALVKQEKITRIIGAEEVVVLPSLNKLGRLRRLSGETPAKSAPTKKGEKWSFSSATMR